MAVHLSIGRISSISLLALLAVAAGAAHYLSRSGPEPATAPASQIPVAQITATVPLAPPFAETMPAEPSPAAVAEAEAEVAHKPEIEAVIVATAGPEPEARAEAEIEAAAAAAVEAAPAANAVQTAPARPVANARQSETGPAVAPVAAPVAAPAAVPPRRVMVTRLVVEPRGSPAPRDVAVSGSRPKNMAPMPTRAPRAAMAGSIAARSAATLFQSGAEIRVKRDASVYITARNIPENDRLLEAYNADRRNGGRVRTRFGDATAAPGLLGIAAQAQRSRRGGQDNPAYSLADAMRDAIWRKETAARLKSLTTAQNTCAEGTGDTAKRAPSIGLVAGC